MLKTLSKILLLTFLVACSSTIEHSTLDKQRLAPRSSHRPNLTNKICKKEKFKKCSEWSILTYDMKNEVVRKQLNQLGFACNLSKKRWRVCSDRPGFCRRETICTKYKRKKCKKKETKETYINLDSYDFLVNSGFDCMVGY